MELCEVKSTEEGAGKAALWCLSCNWKDKWKSNLAGKGEEGNGVKCPSG